MSVDGDMRERHGRVLAELAEAGMAMVRRLGVAMERAEDTQTQVQLGLAFHRVSRAVRQTMALEFRLAQEARREDRGVTASAHRPRPKPAAAASSEPVASRPPTERVGWSEHERDDADETLDALDVLLEAEELDIEAVHDAVEASMARIRRDIAADPLLVKAGVLETGDPATPTRTGVPQAAPAPRNRRSELMGTATLARPPLVMASAVAGPGQPGWRSSA